MDPFGRTAILGLGLMGASLARALREAGAVRELVGYDADPAVRARALEARVVDTVEERAGEAARGAELVVLAAPVRAIVALAGEIGDGLDQGALVLDLGSTKREVVAALDRLPAGTRAVGGHPMCGREAAGLAHADASLFRGAVFSLAATARTDATAREQAEALVRAVGARPLWVEPEAHDRAVAAISQLPYLLSVALVRAVDEADDPLARRLAASGFRDTSRLAASGVGMVLDMLTTNADFAAESLEAAEAQLRALRDLLRRGDADALAAALAPAAEARGRFTAEPPAESAERAD